MRRPMTITIEDELKEKLKHLAFAQKQTMSDVIEMLLIKHFKKLEKRPAGQSEEGI